MAGCGEKIKDRCGTKHYATCTFYEGYLPQWSSLTTESCVTTAETTEELYKKVDEVVKEIDLSGLGKQCITYNKAGDKLLVKEALLDIELKVCELINANSNIIDSFDNCTLDYGTLVDDCNTTDRPTTQCEFNQYILDQLNMLKNGG